MSVWKRNAVVVAIVLFVGAAVYLNWSYNNQTEETGDDPGKVLGETSLVNGEQDEEGTAQTGETGETGETDGEETTQTGYFASARLNRPAGPGQRSGIAPGGGGRCLGGPDPH